MVRVNECCVFSTAINSWHKIVEACNMLCSVARVAEGWKCFACRTGGCAESSRNGSNDGGSRGQTCTAREGSTVHYERSESRPVPSSFS